MMRLEDMHVLAHHIEVTMKQANMRIHVERGMRRGREFALLNRTVPIAHIDLISDEVFLALCKATVRNV